MCTDSLLTCASPPLHRPGVCFRMFSRRQWDAMPSHTAPEMLRSPLERVALLIKGLAGHDLLAGAAGKSGVARVLSRCLSPPSPAAVAAAVQLLRQIGAFDEGEMLTALGGHLNRMPMDPRVGESLCCVCSVCGQGILLALGVILALRN